GAIQRSRKAIRQFRSARQADLACKRRVDGSLASASPPYRQQPSSNALAAARPRHFPISHFTSNDERSVLFYLCGRSLSLYFSQQCLRELSRRWQERRP